MVEGGIDKRVFPRADYPCRLRVTNKFFSYIFETHTENLGIGGVRVILNKQLGQFSEVELKLHLSEEEDPVECLGRVVWVFKRAEYLKNRPNQYDTGVEFINMHSRDKARIAALVDKLKEQEATNAQDSSDL